jgi:dTDP-4-dehydrorhamnose 3,5-epimerase
MHFQKKPHEEAKVVRCTQGALYDVVVDIRPHSPTFCHWIGVELTAKNHKALYVPKGFAHGFQTLVDNTEVLYQMSEQYYPELASGVRWNDAAFAIEWIIHDNVIIAERDAAFPDIQAVMADL